MKKHLTNLTNLLPVNRSLRAIGTMLLVFAVSFSTAMASENLLSERIHLSVENVTLKDALKEIERQSTFTFLYNDASIDVNQTVSVSASELSIKDLLDEILADKGITYTIIDNQIVLTRSVERLQNTVTVSGQITDSETGGGLPGVTVVEKGTTNGTITDLDGNYTLSVAENAVLQISYVGYVTEEVDVAGQTSISISLVPDIISLDDVVVIGYGTVKKSDLNGAVASVSAEELSQSAVSGVDQALQGRTAGVSVTANSGTPGASPSVRIRGMGTMTNADPLFVVDGMPVTAEAVGALNPGDIESTEILKDASAAAIYGSRAGNGVVLITTKKGKEGTSSVNFDAYMGTQTVAKTYDLLDAQEWVTLRNAAGNTWEDSSLVQNTDWQDEIFRNAKISNYQLSFLGGSEKMRYSLIGSYFNQEGIVKGSDYERYTIRVNSSADVKPWLTVGENFSFSHSNQNTISEQDEYTSVVISALTMDPAVPVTLPDTASVLNEYSKYQQALRNNILNPVGLIERNHNVTNSNKLLGNVYVDLKPVKWLSLRTSVGAEITRSTNEQFLPVYYESVSALRDVNGLYRRNYNSNSLVWENTATFSRTLAERHDVTLLAGYTRELHSYDFLAFYAQDVPNNSDLWYISNSNAAAENNEIIDIGSEIGPVTLNDGENQPRENSLVSYFGRLIYSFDGKYDLTATIRRDGSSRFTGENKWGIFPSFNLGWKISEEAFFSNVDFISFFKLRAGWGKIGNQEIGDYGAYTPISYNINYTLGSPQVSVPGGAPTSIGNTNLFWESTVMTNVGTDVYFLNNRLTVNADYFIRKTSDMLSEVPIPYLTGVTDAPFVNEGEVENRGFELNLTWKESRGDFSYSINGNIAFLSNEVTYLPVSRPSAQFRSAGFVSLSEEGQPIASFYGFKTDGYWQTQEEIDAANAAARAATGDDDVYFDTRFTSPGDIKFVDVNGDGIVRSDDQDFIGSPHPDVTYGINIDLQYKIVDLKIFGQGVAGNELFHGPIFYLESPNAYWNNTSNMLDYWQEEGDNSEVPRLDFLNGNNNLRFSDRYINSGSYFRLKNVQLGVSLPDEIGQRFGVSKLRVYVAAQNLLTITKYEGFDPEVGTNGRDQLDIGIDRGLYPVARTYLVGLNLTF